MCVWYTVCMVRLTTQDCKDMVDIYEYFAHDAQYALTFKDLARMFDVSLSTVKRVMGNLHPCQAQIVLLRRRIHLGIDCAAALILYHEKILKKDCVVACKRHYYVVQ